MSLIMPGCALVFLSIMAFWKESTVGLMLAGAASVVLGLYWFTVYTTDIGLSVSLILICYGFFCWGSAYKTMFVRKFMIAGKEE